MNGFELILPFLRPIQNLILDPDISEIMVNGSECVFIERRGYADYARDVPVMLISSGRSIRSPYVSHTP